MVYLGTSGYSYRGWVGPFYPPDTKRWDFFAHYVKHFNAVELNFTYYKMPSAQTLRNLLRQTPPGFQFAVKAPRAIMMSRKEDPSLFQAFHESLDPLLAASALGAILLQFPARFDFRPDHLAYLAYIREQWPELPLAVEFRHRSWVEKETTFEQLRQLQIAYCCVDQPRLPTLLPPLIVVTAPFAYVRFHGRNPSGWEPGERGDRYNYRYSEAELREWIAPLRQLQEETKALFIFFNNTVAAYANALELAALLGVGHVSPP